MALNAQTIKLNTGTEVPMLGLGTGKRYPGQVEKAVETALKEGYKHIDTAAVYENEEEVGRGIRESGVKREEIFITAKLWNNKHHPEDVEKALDESLGKLGLKYVDLYLMNWPVSFSHGDDPDDKFPKDKDGKFLIDSSISLQETWKAMEKLVEKDKAKAIGVANFSISEIEQILPSSSSASASKFVPAMLQIEAHPYNRQQELVKYAQEKGIAVTAYWPLGNPNHQQILINDPVVQEIAKKMNIGPAQVLILYALTRGMCVIPKSLTPDRIAANLNVFKLSEENVKSLDDLKQQSEPNQDFVNKENEKENNQQT